jgi:hypothetical protein
MSCEGEGKGAGERSPVLAPRDVTHVGAPVWLGLLVAGHARGLLDVHALEEGRHRTRRDEGASGAGTSQQQTGTGGGARVRHTSLGFRRSPRAHRLTSALCLHFRMRFCTTSFVLDSSLPCPLRPRVRLQRGATDRAVQLTVPQRRRDTLDPALCAARSPRSFAPFRQVLPDWL